MGKPRNCNCCDFNLPSGFVCIYCDDSGDPVCTESLTSVQCSGVSGIHMPGSCSDFPGSYCGKCDDAFESSPCESFFLSKNAPVKGDSNVFASGSYSPEKPLDLERIPNFTSHFKRGHHLRDYKGTGTHGWLSGIVPIGPTNTAGFNARLEFVNNQFPYIEGDTPTDIDYIGLCDKRRGRKYGCATIKFKNTVVGSTTTKVDKFHLKIGTFQRYGDRALLTSALFANNQIVPAKYIGPFTSASEHINKFNSVCEDPADALARGGNGVVYEGVAHVGSFFDDSSAHCYGDLPMACCASLTKSISAEYEFDVSSFPLDTCFTLYNFALVGTSSSSYGYFELTGESPNFFEISTPTLDQNFPDCTAGFFSDNFPGCRFDTPGFNCDPPPPPPPPTTTPPPPPPPPCGGGQFHCKYEYRTDRWVSLYDPTLGVGACEPIQSRQCGCPSLATVANEWNSQNGSDPSDGSCIDFYVPCCRPCFDYTVITSEVCGTTTTTTEGPTTTTTTTLEPEPTAVVACLGQKPDCCDDPAFTVVGDNCCADDPHGRIYRRPPRDCTDFSSFQEASQYHQDLSLGGYLAYLFSNKTCAELQPTLESMTCEECECATTTTTTQGPTTTTTQGPTTTTTQGPTTTTTQGPTTTTTQGPTTTTTEGPTTTPGPTTTTTAAPTTTTTPCPCPCPQNLSWTIFMNSFGDDCTFNASDTASDTISNYDGGCNGTYNYTDAGTFPCGDSWTTSITCDSSKAANDTDRWSGSFNTCNLNVNAPAGADDPTVLGSCSAPPVWTVSGLGEASCFCCGDGGDDPDPPPPDPDPEDPV